MHPVSSKAFGNATGRVQVQFTLEAGGITTGWIVKQIGTHRYRVSDGTETRNCYLAQTTAKAGTLGDEAMTILITKSDASVEHVRKLFSVVALTTEGSRLTWQIGGSTANPLKGAMQARP